MNQVQALLKALKNELQEEGKSRKPTLDVDIVLQLGNRRIQEHQKDPTSRITCVLTAFYMLWKV